MFRLFAKIIAILLVCTLFESTSKLKSFAEENIKNDITESVIPLDYLDYSPESEYILGNGDHIAIIYNNPEIDDKLLVISGDGTIYTKRLNRIYVQGLTIKELTSLINQRLSKFLISPDISIVVTQYRPVRVYVTGEIVNPGSYLLGGIDRINFDETNSTSLDSFSDDGMSDGQNNTIVSELDISTRFSKTIPPTLFDAIQIAKGVTLYSDLTHIEVIRINPISKGGGKITTTLNLLNVIENGMSDQNIRLLDGDTIKVKKSSLPLYEQFKKATRTNLQSQFNRVFISGRVEEPGMKIVNKSATLNDLITLSGGTKVLSGKIYHIRFNSDGTLTRRKINYRRNAPMNKKNNPILLPGDIVSVDSNLILKGSDTLGEITKPFVGIFSSYSFFKMLSDL